MFVCIHHNLRGCHRAYICKTDCKMLWSAKVMVVQRVVQYTPDGSGREGNVIGFKSKINSRNLVIVAL